jgi:ParB/RepB/Spo0J family partition protein
VTRGQHAALLRRVAPGGAASADAPVEIDGVVLSLGLQSVPFRLLRISPRNARTIAPAESEIAGLADSIHAHTTGDCPSCVLQNLVVRPEREGEAWFLGVLAGGRRWRAVAHNIALGRCTADYPVPVNITRLDDLAALELSIAENDQREQLQPLEQGAAYAEALKLGATVDALMARAGRPRKFVLQRLAFHTRLSDRVKEVFAQGLIDIGQAQAFTLGDKDEQDALLPAVLSHAGHYRAETIRAAFTDSLIPLSRAIFDTALIQGVRHDLFREEVYAEDRAEFARLQRDAVEARRDALRAEGWAWVTVATGGPFPPGPFRYGVPAGEGGGAVIHVADNLAVKIVTGLRPIEIAPPPALRSHSRPREGVAPPAVASAAPAAPAIAPLQSAEHLLWARCARSSRLQLAVADHDTAWLALIALMLLGCPELGVPRRPLQNPALRERVRDIEANSPGIALDLARERPELTFDGLLTLPRFALLALVKALVADRVLAWPERLGGEPGDSRLTIAIADAVAARDPDSFVIPPGYLERLGLGQLRRVARECGIADAVFGLDREAAIEAIGLSLDRDPAWRPPELSIGPYAEITARLLPAEEAP